MVSLFDGIGALRIAVDALQVPVAGYVAAEISPEARRVVESWFPEVVGIEDVKNIDGREEFEIPWCLCGPPWRWATVSGGVGVEHGSERCVA